MFFNPSPLLSLTDIYGVIYSYKNLKQILTQTDNLRDGDEEIKKNN